MSACCATPHFNLTSVRLHVISLRTNHVYMLHSHIHSNEPFSSNSTVLIDPSTQPSKLIHGLRYECCTYATLNCLLSALLYIIAHCSSLNVAGSAIATTLHHHTHIYIAALLHRSSINSVLHFPSPLYVTVMSPDLPTALPNY
jgi:hypothetical protein